MNDVHQNDIAFQEFLIKKKQEYEERFHPGKHVWLTDAEKDGLIRQWFVSSMGEGLQLFAGTHSSSTFYDQKLS